MENAVQALKIAFGVLVFVIAITVSFMLFSQAKSTADIVMYSSDKTNYYSYDEEEKQAIVDVDTVISMLYRCYQESITIEIFKNNGNLDKTFDKNISKEDTKDYIENNLLGTNKEFKETFSVDDEGKITIKYKEY